MKQLKEFTGHVYEPISEKLGPIDPPAMLTLHRKYIRIFPDGTKVATYYSDALQKTFTLPFSELQSEAVVPKKKPKDKLPKDEDDPEAFSADNLATLKNIVQKNKSDTLEFADGSELDVEPPTANAIMATYARCSKENKEKIELMLTKGVSTFMRLSKIAMSA